MHKALIVIAACVTITIVGLSALAVSLFRKIPDSSFNVCDGKEHTIGSIAITVSECRVNGKDLTLKTSTKNISKGSVFCPTKQIRVKDNFGNTIHINDRPALAIVPGDIEHAEYSGLVMSDAATKFTVSIDACIGQNSDGKQFIQEITGTFNR